MLDHQIGLTTTYHLLLGFDLTTIESDATHKHDAPATDPRLTTLRALHLELDRAVLDTYAEQLGASTDPPASTRGSPICAPKTNSRPSTLTT